MSELFLNDISLVGQYSEGDAFLEAMKVVLDARKQVTQSGFRFYCDANIRLRPVVRESNFQQVVLSWKNKEIKSAVLSCISKSGWIENRLHSDQDIFAFNDDDVANTTLAEAAFRTSTGTSGDLFTFNPSPHLISPLIVEWTQQSGAVNNVAIENFWDLIGLRRRLATTESPIKDWPKVLVRAKRTYPNLLISADAIDPLLNEPFSPAASDDIMMLLRVLDEVSASHDKNGALNEHGLELTHIYFEGHRARYSDETPNSKFEFYHPETRRKIMCSWHGKIRLGGLQYRIHFQWPKPPAEPLWVSYIGPKLTKW